MNEYTTIYKTIEFILFSSYLIFIFLVIQIWLLWKDIEKKELVLKSFINESFFKKNCASVFSFSIFFMVHEILEGLNFPNAIIYFEFFEMLALIFLVLFAYNWYVVLKTCAHKKSPLAELTSFTR